LTIDDWRARPVNRGEPTSKEEEPMALLTRDEVARNLSGLEGWTLDGSAIKKQFTFAGFPEAVAFVQRLVPDAEAADHHPDLTINYKRVTVSYSTHSEGGLTAKDFVGAKSADAAAAAG
jgi:4a-hydroxytetrahydrobiopterin dehydratase